MLFIVVCRAVNLLKYAHEYIQKNAQSFAFGQPEVRRNDGLNDVRVKGNFGAAKKIRTSTGLPLLAPEASVSTISPSRLKESRIIS